MLNPFFYAPTLLDIIPQVKIMSFILTAIHRNLVHLFFTVVLAVLFLYLVAVFVYSIVPDQYNLGGHNDCHDIVRCFKLHLDYGLFNSPDWLGESVTVIKYDDRGFCCLLITYHRVGDGVVVPQVQTWASATATGFVFMSMAGTVFNFIYILLINLVLQAIISGLIIDAFSELRDENDVIEKDSKSFCFICSIDK